MGVHLLLEALVHELLHLQSFCDFLGFTPGSLLLSALFLRVGSEWRNHVAAVLARLLEVVDELRSEVVTLTVGPDGLSDGICCARGWRWRRGGRWTAELAHTAARILRREGRCLPTFEGLLVVMELGSAKGCDRLTCNHLSAGAAMWGYTESCTLDNLKQ